MDNIPKMPKEGEISLTEYIYKILYSHIGGESDE